MKEYQTCNPQVYLYIFDGAWPGEEELRGAHSVDLNFTFNTLASIAESLPADNPDQMLADKWQDSLIAFARSGNPNTPAIPNWPLYNAETKSVMWFGNKIEYAKATVNIQTRNPGDASAHMILSTPESHKNKLHFSFGERPRTWWLGHLGN